MKKIMFNDRYGLTTAVLEGRKTMTRRIVPGKLQEHLNACGNPVLVVPLECIPQGMTIEEFAQAWNRDTGKLTLACVEQYEKIEVIDVREDLIKNVARYKVGEVVAVAQNLRDMGYDPRDTKHRQGEIWGLDHSPAWTNKMFVSASECIHHIRITNVRVERLQDISDEDCLCEGIYETMHHSFGYPPSERQRTFQTAVYERYDAFSTPRRAFSALIDKVSGKGVWDSNPFVFVYEFELVK